MSDWREQAKAAIEEALGHGYSSLDNLLDALVDAAAPAIRADEAERTLDRWLASDHVERVLDVREAEVRERLRAQVEALYIRCTDDPTRNGELADWVRRDAVLDLLDWTESGDAEA